jgi:putative ABC transport system ATP-binding protein
MGPTPHAPRPSPHANAHAHVHPRPPPTDRVPSVACRSGDPAPRSRDGQFLRCVLRFRTVLRLEKINKYYRVGQHRLHALCDVDLEIDRGELVSIMGASGSGKSTLLNILGILDAYESGEYWLGDQLIRNVSETQAARYRNRFIGFVFQSFNLLPFKTALENVALPLYYQGVSRRQRNRTALGYLEQVGLAEWAEHRPSELSGGQKQRVAIARALIGQPQLILADEPTGALDSETSGQIMDLLAAINAQGITVLVVTHESDVAARTRRIIRLRDGKIMADEAHPELRHEAPV